MKRHFSPSLLAGAVLWAGSLQFIVMEFVVQSAWKVPYSFNKNYISDLGAQYSGVFPPGSGNWISSPWHSSMNASFIVFGLTCAIGAVMIRSALVKHFGDHRLQLNAIMICFVLTGTGVVLIGCNPEDARLQLHLSGALLQVISSNIAFVLSGILLIKTDKNAWGTASIVAGIFSFTAFLVTGYVGLKGPLWGVGAGAWERMSIWTMVLWLVTAGLVAWKTSLKTNDHFKAV